MSEKTKAIETVPEQEKSPAETQREKKIAVLKKLARRAVESEAGLCTFSHSLYHNTIMMMVAAGEVALDRRASIVFGGGADPVSQMDNVRGQGKMVVYDDKGAEAFLVTKPK